MDIQKTLIEGLSQSMVQARLNTIDAKPFLFGTHFPIKKVIGFSWKTLQNQLSKMHVAADIHADNSTYVRKKRPTFEVASGDLPFIAISRDMTRSEIKEYQTALALAKVNGGADATKLVQYWGEDVDFCFNGVQSELEYIAWSLLSNAGVLKFTTNNNATFANEFDLDYQVDAQNKVATTSDWGVASSADIIGDLAKIIKQAKANGMNPKFAFVNLDTFYKIASAEQIIKACASFAQNALNISQTPDLQGVNTMLARQAWLNGIQFIVIDQTITREFKDGSQTSGNPFADDVVILSENRVLGSTQYDILGENNENVIRAVRNHTVIRKYGVAEPQGEVTMGQADALPVLDSAYRNVYVKTNANSW